jgi:hypothetical protein
MATKPKKGKKFPFTILRDDNTYLTYDMTRREFDELFLALEEGKPFIKVDAGIISLKDVRHVIEVEPVVEVENRPEAPPVSLAEQEQYNRFIKMFDEEDEDQWPIN